MFSCFLASVFIYLSGVFLNYFATHHIHIIDNEKVGIVNKKSSRAGQHYYFLR